VLVEVGEEEPGVGIEAEAVGVGRGHDVGDAQARRIGLDELHELPPREHAADARAAGRELGQALDVRVDPPAFVQSPRPVEVPRDVEAAVEVVRVLVADELLERVDAVRRLAVVRAERRLVLEVDPPVARRRPEEERLEARVVGGGRVDDDGQCVVCVARDRLEERRLAEELRRDLLRRRVQAVDGVRSQRRLEHEPALVERHGPRQRERAHLGAQRREVEHRAVVERRVVEELERPDRPQPRARVRRLDPVGVAGPRPPAIGGGDVEVREVPERPDRVVRQRLALGRRVEVHRQGAHLVREARRHGADPRAVRSVEAVLVADLAGQREQAVVDRQRLLVHEHEPRIGAEAREDRLERAQALERRVRAVHADCPLRAQRGHPGQRSQELRPVPEDGDRRARRALRARAVVGARAIELVEERDLEKEAQPLEPRGVRRGIGRLGRDLRRDGLDVPRGDGDRRVGIVGPELGQARGRRRRDRLEEPRPGEGRPFGAGARRPGPGRDPGERRPERSPPARHRGRVRPVGAAREGAGRELGLESSQRRRVGARRDGAREQRERERERYGPHRIRSPFDALNVLPGGAGQKLALGSR
jgi:hypothetical protein